MKKKPKLSEGQNIIRGSVNTAMLLMLLALPVSINILPQDLGFPVLLIILIIIVIMGRPNTDEVTLAEPRWKWMLLRFLVTAAFAVLAWNFAQLTRAGGMNPFAFGGSGSTLINAGTTAASQGAVWTAMVVFWFLPALFISSYLATVITRRMFVRSQEITQA